MTPDSELLNRYAANGDEAAFAELVRRQVNLVYSVALRVANGNAALAEDVTQSVFTDLARKAGPLSNHEALVGWLHTSARFAALKAVRREQRHQAHEHEASTMQDHSTTAEYDWEHLWPVLDEAVSRLREKDRAAIVLRFFQGLSHRDVGEVLGLNENTARKRVDRALEKLRVHFTRAGITVSSALLATTLTAHSQEMAPAGLAEKITKPVLAGVVNSGALATILLRIFYMSTKTKTSLTLAAMAALIAFIVIGPWWHTQHDAVPEKTAVVSANSPARAVDQPAAPPAQPITPQQTTSTGSALTPTVDPHNNLDTALADLARLQRTTGSGSLWALQQEWLAPDVLAKMSPEEVAINKTISTGTNFNKDLAQAIEALQGMTPVYNSSGDEATYTFILNHKELPSMTSAEDEAMSAEDRAILNDPKAQAFLNMLTAPTTHTLVLVKINGRWYVKSGLNTL